MKILGIDPGTARAGYGIIYIEKKMVTLHDFGILSQNEYTHHIRLCNIRNSIVSIIKREKPSRAVVESLFFSKNQKTALLVAEARGVIIQTLAEFHIPTIELTPNQIKLAVTGNGTASKNAVKKMLSLLLKKDFSLVLDDSTDAIAAAVAGYSVRL